MLLFDYQKKKKEKKEEYFSIHIVHTPTQGDITCDAPPVRRLVGQDTMGWGPFTFGGDGTSQK